MILKYVFESLEKLPNSNTFSLLLIIVGINPLISK